MRTIAALYDTRAEADLARMLLEAEVRTRSLRIIGKDTIGAVDGLKIAQSDAAAYREGLQRGGHLLVSEVAGGADAKRIIELLKASADVAAERPPDRAWGDGEKGIGVELPKDQSSEPPPTPARPKEAQLKETGQGARPGNRLPPAEGPVEEASIPAIEEELQVAKQPVDPGGARVRSFTREEPAEEQVSLREESLEVENRPSDRHISEAEIEAGGLFKERVIEIAEMREEPVVTKVAVVREEVIVRKKVTERTETIRDTVRHTEIEVEDIAPSESAPRFLMRDTGGEPSRR